MTIGQLATATPPATNGSNIDFIPANVAAGNGYVVTETGTITTWSHLASTGPGQTLTLKVFRKVSDPALFQVIGLNGPQNLNAGILNTFPVSISVQAGDVIGLGCLVNASGCLFAATPQDSFFNRGALPTTLGLGDAGSFSGPGTGSRLNVLATLEPSNVVTLGATTLNKKKGTATVNLTLPNSGDLTATGSGVSAASAGRAVTSKAVGAGPAQLLVKATGKKRKTLNATGKVKLNVAITYTPTNGSPGTQSVKVKLKKK